MKLVDLENQVSSSIAPNRLGRFGRVGRIVGAGVLVVSSGCTLEAPDPGPAELQKGTATTTTSFEDFEAKVIQDSEGVYIVDGDTPIDDIKKLREFYDRVFAEGKLIVDRNGGVDSVWTSTQKLNISYCVSSTFGSNKAKVVQAMADATAAWSAVANVKFAYLSAQDASCTASNQNVVFDVRPTSGQAYLARAFFPNQGRSTRNVIIDSSSFNAGGGWTLTGILRHEFGHALGFRHEHTRPEAGTCFEDSNWRALTPYDRQSVMHYPQCNGSNNGLQITATDAAGAKALYGAPGSNPNPDPDPTPPPKTDTGSGTLARGQSKAHGPYDVTTKFKAVINGTGDADLYVRFGSAPTTTVYNCRPYTSSSNETCDLDVPAGQTKAYVTVRGYAAASYNINVTYQ